MNALVLAAEESGGLQFPSLSNLIEWKPIIDSIGLDKIGLTHVLSVIIPTIVFFLAAQQKGLVPSGIRTVAEGMIEFIENQIILPAIGADGLKYLPLLLSFFLFVFFGNITEVIPFFQMPANARMGGPVVIALIAWAMFISVGFKHNGFTYLKDIAWPPSVPLGLRWLVGLIELLSTFILRPFSHAVRLFANMLAGHILLVTFAVLSITVASGLMFLVLPFTFGGLVAFTAFEIFVSLIQAFVFTIIAAVYIGGALHPAH
ncbi:MAG: F0F1 ATP synthase subunit A [Acidimicrobiales bacterium]|nr:F0F1 ATP synthase subunit A [Acidimicrobiales bacterium]